MEFLVKIVLSKTYRRVERDSKINSKGKETSSNSGPIFVLQLDLVLVNIQSRLEFEKIKLDKSEGLGDKENLSAPQHCNF